MKLRIAFFAGIIAVGQASAWAQTPAPSQSGLPTVRVGLFRLGADGRIAGSATGGGNHAGAEMASTIFLAPCDLMGATGSDRAISAAATDVWKVTGTVLELSAERASVQVGWQRVRKDGQDALSAPQSTTITLNVGDRTTLETLSIPARGSCAAKDVSLDITLEARSERSSGGGGGRGTSSDAVKPKIDIQSTGGGGGAVSIGAGGSLKIMRADMWLVRTSPGRADETLHLTTQLFVAPSEFTFAPMLIKTNAGTFTVTVRGTIETGQTPTGDPRLFFSANRTTAFAPATRAARDAQPTVEGSTKTSVPMPGPDDVLSFEMPPLRVPGGAAVPDKLSVRVKVFNALPR